MKFRNMLFIFSICTIGFTTMASTPLPEQKQETVFVMEPTFQTNVENVVAIDVVCNANTSIFNGVTSFDFANIIKNSNTLSIVNDVGLNGSWADINEKFSNEKLSENYNLHFIQKLNRPIIHVRVQC